MSFYVQNMPYMFMRNTINFFFLYKKSNNHAKMCPPFDFVRQTL